MSQSESEKWVLVSRWPLPGRDWYWTRAGDYSRDIAASIQFDTEAEGQRWLAVHRHLRGALQLLHVVIVAEVAEAQRH